MIGGIQYQIVGLEKLDKEGNYVFVANHESAMDIPLVFAGLPYHLVAIAKIELKRIPIFGWAMMAGGHFFVDRRNHAKALNSLDKAKDSMAKNPRSIIIFPEGTRSLANGLADFKRSAAWIALKSGFPVVPAVLSISAPILMKDWKWYQVPPHSIEMLLEIHEPLYVEHVLENSNYDPVSARKFTTILQQFYEKKVIFNDNKRK